MSSDVVKLREQRSKYFTNRGIKAYTLFIWLKNQTESGYIHNYEKQHYEICEALKISRATFYNYLKTAESLGLINRRNGRLELASWDRVVEDLILPEKSFRYIYYDTENEKQKLHLILEAVEFDENRAKQEAAITYKLAKNQHIKAAFELFCSHTDQELEFNLHNLSAAKRYIFKFGSADSIYNALMHLVNPEFYRNSSTIARAHGYKSPRTVTYLKRKLKRAGLATIVKVSPNECSYQKNRREGIERGKNVNGTTYYRINERKKVWFEPEKVILNQLIFTKPENEKTPA